MGQSFQQKSLWLMFVSLVVGFGSYFAGVLPATSAEIGPQHVARFAGAVGVLVVFQVLGHVVIALFDRRPGTDERDRLYGLLGSRAASYVLATGIFAALCAALLTEGNFIFSHLLLAAWVLAQLVEIGTQLLLYQRGG